MNRSFSMSQVLLHLKQNFVVPDLWPPWALGRAWRLCLDHMMPSLKTNDLRSFPFMVEMRFQLNW